jgi:phage baseplate assembly protein W
MIHVDYPYGVASSGRTATTGWTDHVRDLVEQLLFTSPGERVNRPDFGCGLGALVFEPNSDELVGTVQALVIGSLQSRLGDVIDVQAVEVRAEDAVLRVAVSYRVLSTGEELVEHFRRGAA